MCHKSQFKVTQTLTFCSPGTATIKSRLSSMKRNSSCDTRGRRGGGVDVDDDDGRGIEMQDFHVGAPV